MPNDAFDPGPNQDYPWFPRRPSTGEPLWSDRPEDDGQQVEGVTPMPRGIRREYPLGKGYAGVLVDVTPRHTDGTPINPPTLPV